MKCNALNDKSSRKYKCGFPFTTFPSRKELLGSVPNQHSHDIPSIKLEEIIGVNPNSNISIREVLENLCKQIKVEEKRA